jgi:hypothetical protein
MITLVDFKSEKYGECILSENPQVGYDILAILEKEEPYQGTVEVPVYIPSSSPGCSGYPSNITCNIKSVKKIPMFLLAKSKDQSVKERDERIHKLEMDLRDSVKLQSEVNKIAQEQRQKREDLEGKFKHLDKAWAEVCEKLRMYENHTTKAQRLLGDVKWAEIIK